MLEIISKDQPFWFVFALIVFFAAYAAKNEGLFQREDCGTLDEELMEDGDGGSK